uniref:RNA-directed DNA polymerase (Reverse transcriptase) domain containing protein n=1 Tax=Haemonchus contortus TaxID=6289 RepID=A0A7I4Y2Z4_HAECO
MKFRKRSLRTSINRNHFASLASKWEDSVMDNIDEEYNRLVEHLHDSATKAESLQVTLFEDSRADTPAEAIKENPKERRAAVTDEAAEAEKSIRKARRSFANYKTKMTSLRRPDGTVTASRRAMEKVIYDFYSDLFDSHVYLPTHHLRQDEYIAPSVLSSEIRHAITSMKNCTAPGPDGIKPAHLKSIPPVIIKTLARLFTRYLSECKVPTSWKTSKSVLLGKKGDPDDIGNYRPICLLSVIYKLFTRVILNRIGRILGEGQPCE